MRNIKLAAIQMASSEDVTANIEKAEELIRKAASAGAKIILLPELFERTYFCQERRYENYAYAHSIDESVAVQMGVRLAKELEVVLPIPFCELDNNVIYNSVAVVDVDGRILGIYRKTHIPDDHFYQEKFYFTPGDKGFPVFNTRYARIGVGICWDQWFPEVARSLAINGAELLLFPSTIGSELILECDSQEHWRRAMQGHAACNLMPVIATNRIGIETIKPHMSNNFQSSSLEFYGSSFIADATGKIVESASRDQEEILYHEFDLDELYSDRMSWSIFRDRRPMIYKDLVK